MVKSKKATTSTSSPKIIPTIPGFVEGGKDIVGMKPALGRTNNNVLYVGLAGLFVIGGYIISSNPALLGSLMGKPPGPPAAVQVTPPSVQPGQSVTIQGMFSPPVPQAFYVVTNSQGQQVASGSLGNNVSQFSQVIQPTSLPSGSYTVTVSDSQPQGVGGGPQGPGQTFATSATLQQGLTGSPPSLGSAQSGPENISLT